MGFVWTGGGNGSDGAAGGAAGGGAIRFGGTSPELLLGPNPIELSPSSVPGGTNTKSTGPGSSTLGIREGITAGAANIGGAVEAAGAALRERGCAENAVMSLRGSLLGRNMDMFTGGTVIACVCNRGTSTSAE